MNIFFFSVHFVKITFNLTPVLTNVLHYFAINVNVDGVSRSACPLLHSWISLNNHCIDRTDACHRVSYTNVVYILALLKHCVNIDISSVFTFNGS